MLEVTNPAQGDGVEVKKQGPQVQVSLRFANGVRVTPLVKTVWGEVPGPEPGAQGRLASAVREERYEEALRALEEVAGRQRDNAAVEVLETLPEEALRRMAVSREGNLLLESLFNALTSGYVTQQEMRLAAGLLAAEAQRRYPTPEELVRAAGQVRVFPYEAMGLTKGGAPLTARLREDGRIGLSLTPRSFENKYRAEAATLYGLHYELEPDELVGVKLYDEGGGRVYVPALYLLLLSHEDSARVAWKMVEAGALGLSLGAGVLAETGVEAGAAARVLMACDRVAVAMGVATSLLLEHRGWLLERFGDEGRGFVYGLEVFHSALAVYGIVRLGVAAPALVRGMRELYRGFLQRAQAQRQLGRLTQEEAARVGQLQQQMEGMLQDLEAMREAGKVTPPGEVGAKVISLESARRGGRAPGAGVPPSATEEQVPLAATGTDARLLPIERKVAMGQEAPVASLRRREASGSNRPPSPSVSRVEGNVGAGNPGGPKSTGQRPARALPAPRKHRLDTVEEWRKPRLTADGKVLPYKGTRDPPEPITILGRNRAGTVISDGESTVRFDKNGFAEFDPLFETLLDNSHIGSARPAQHFRAANQRLYEAIRADPDLAREIGLSSEEIARLPARMDPPNGFIWHHHQDVGRMQLIHEGAHRLANSHTGGMAIWGGGYRQLAPGRGTSK
ncbi:HNH endonuclease [Archangium sp.]|uniref:HNH endonuclease n=1 Tax=Archangium sp. TaxID=1872627 RepID=UPI002D6BF687|nr:HNH endonuclease [Archangium sp.]HYO56702.1 HNH endonuclease [Archangium sp.]